MNKKNLKKKGYLLNCCIVHCTFLHTKTATHCILKQNRTFDIASMANTRMSLSHSGHLQCYLKIRYIHDALRSGYATMHNATIQKRTFFELGVLFGLSPSFL